MFLCWDKYLCAFSTFILFSVRSVSKKLRSFQTAFSISSLRMIEPHTEFWLADDRFNAYVDIPANWVNISCNKKYIVYLNKTARLLRHFWRNTEKAYGRYEVTKLTLPKISPKRPQTEFLLQQNENMKISFCICSFGENFQNSAEWR